MARRPRQEGPGRRLVVHVVWRESRGTFVLRAVDADTQQVLCQKTGNTTKRPEADRQVPAFLEKACANFHGVQDGRLSWNTVCERYDTEVLAGMSPGGRNKFWNARNKLHKIAEPISLYDIDADMLSRFRGAMIAEEMAQDTIIGYLAEISRCLNWATEIWTDYKPPKIRKPKRKQRKGPRGRPITNEEFERMLKKTKPVLSKMLGRMLIRKLSKELGKKQATKRARELIAERAREWRRLLIGLRLSGLRIAEAMDLTWDERGRVHVCDLDRDLARLYFRDQKSGKESKCPITTAFDRFLRKTPEAERRGYVFRPKTSWRRVCKDTASKVISKIGRKAGVVVGSRRVLDKKKNEYKDVKLPACAHDLRRTFATKLAPRVKSAAVLALYLRDTIQTAQQYYVDVDLEAAEQAVRKARPKTAGSKEHDQKHDQTAEGKGMEGHKV